MRDQRRRGELAEEEDRTSGRFSWQRESKLFQMEEEPEDSAGITIARVSDEVLCASRLELAGRVVRSASDWQVVAEIAARELVLWGLEW
jgi:hypothetical protein